VTTSVTRHVDDAAIRAFHDLLDETAGRGGFNARSEAFLHQVAAAFAPVGGWYLCLASKGDRPIGGMVVLRVGDRGYYLYGASTRDPAMKHAHPGYASMAAILAALAADGATELDAWGVADTGSEESESWSGFSFFKQRFGGAEVRHAGTWDLVVSPLWYALRDARERLRSAR
jgi:lipid II:glycine glycyltransferase (peptidoglycan interpeptide bridge formation enzyme)